MKRATQIATLLAATLAVACGGSGSGDDPNPGAPDAGVTDPNEPDAGPELTEWEQLLEEREVDYNAALRIAALRLTGDLPTLTEIKFVADAVDKKTAYEALVDSYLDDPRFTDQMIMFWKDAFKMGGTPLLDSAPIFAAQLAVEDRPYTELFTAASGNCPTYDGEAFAAAECDNGVPAHAGLLTHPGVNAHFASNMAFRRTRWVQETFACTAFPAEVTTPQDVGGASLYTAPWPFDSIAGYANGGEIDFLDVSAVTCANCHATMNHVAPLFGHFDDDGMWSDEIAVTNPTDGLPTTKLTDWLPAGETTAWRMGVPAADLPALGAAMAADPAIAECAVARIWNWAFGKGDIVDTLSLVPEEVIHSQVIDFQQGFLLRPLIYSVFTSDDFVKF
jgi:hypothetical protein